MRKVIPLLFALLLVVMFVTPAISASAYSSPAATISPIAEWVISWYDGSEWFASSLPIFTAEIEGNDFPLYGAGMEPVGTVSVYYSNIEQSFTFDIFWDVDIEEVQLYTNSAMYIAPDPVDPLPLFQYFAGEDGWYHMEYNLATLSYSSASNAVQWDYQVITSEALYSDGDSWGFVPQINSYGIVTSCAIDVYADSSIGAQTFVVRAVPSAYFSQNGDLSALLTAWDTNTPIPSPPIVEVNPVEWLSELARGILGLEIFPGFTIGGIVFAFLFVTVAIALLKLYAGG